MKNFRKGRIRTIGRDENSAIHKRLAYHQDNNHGILITIYKIYEVISLRPVDYL